MGSQPFARCLGLQRRLGPALLAPNKPYSGAARWLFFPLNIVNYARDQAAAHYTASQDLAERFTQILSVLPICTGHRFLGPMKGPHEWSEKTHEVHCACCRKHGWTSKNTIWKGGHEASHQHIDAYVQVRSETRTACVHGGGFVGPGGSWQSCDQGDNCIHCTSERKELVMMTGIAGLEQLISCILDCRDMRDLYIDVATRQWNFSAL